MVGGPRSHYRPTDGLKKPKRLSEIPSYLLKLAKGFFGRLFYIFTLVWEAAPWLLIAMIALCVLDGVVPVVGAYISSDLLNAVQSLIGATVSDSIVEDVFNTMKPLLMLFLAYFIYLFTKKILNRINITVTGIAGELVVNHIKLKIMNKAREVDLRSFDRPEFYEKLENANREAGMRPPSIQE